MRNARCEEAKRRGKKGTVDPSDTTLGQRCIIVDAFPRILLIANGSIPSLSLTRLASSTAERRRVRTWTTLHVSPQVILSYIRLGFKHQGCLDLIMSAYSRDTRAIV
ncbi:PREDICTED: uncharacterized protein LOC105567735 [Vollenhovia emeryi]|uniref:uncharacterized protein LOC105567735 n=1 Tax=Vollenhovia emeryi TaxID=411798 RepID=UPI0005F41E6C|nr:PREDICTED: uncharacterized protein LOC105567735 [Vollenhovia emeryi]